MAVRQLGDLCRDSVGVCDELNGSAIVDNLQFILQRIENASKKAEGSPYWRGQNPSLVAVSKTKSPSLIQCCYDAGQKKFGENYIQELVDKAEALKSKCPTIQWHFIGTIQSNKIAKLAEIDNLYCVETICSKKHSSILEKAIAKHNRTLKVLVQVNTSKENQKGGITPEMAVELAEFIRMHCPSLKFSGFMTIGSFAHNALETSNKEFKELFEVRKRFCELTKKNEEDFELSMGMSNDFEAAIMLGSTSVRVGSAIFGPRLQTRNIDLITYWKMKNGHKRKSLMQKYVKIFIVIFLYWLCSIGLVFLNKYLLSSESLKLNAPLFITWYQCFVTVMLCCAFYYFSKLYPSLFTFPFMAFDHRISREVLPLSFIFVAMIATNNLCLKYVGVSFYYIGRSLATVFNVICSYLILGQLASLKAILCCALIIGGFFLGVDQEDDAGTLSITGVIYGVAASVFVALNAIYTQRTLPSVGDSIAQLILYNNINALVLFLPVMLFTGDISEVFYFRYLSSLRFWTLMTLSGIFGFLMSYVTGWQIQVTSPLTHNISGTAKAAAQTIIAVVWWQEMKSLLWWISNAVVLGGSAAYTMVKRKEMVDEYETNKSKFNENIERHSVLFASNDENETV